MTQRAAEIGADAALLITPSYYRSQMTPAIGIGLEPGRLENGYARFQKLVGQWREIAGLYYGDFYPLTPYRMEQTEWMAWQFDAPERGEGMVQAFRLLNGLEDDEMDRLIARADALVNQADELDTRALEDVMKEFVSLAAQASADMQIAAHRGGRWRGACRRGAI